MKIRNRLTLLITSIIAAILLAFAISIYYLYAQNREDEYVQQLIQQATTKANLLLDAKIDPSALQLIYKNSRDTYSEEEVAIYDTDFRLLYHDAVDIDIVKETDEMLRDIQQKKKIAFTQDGWQVAGFIFEFEGAEYIVTAAGYDAYGFQKLVNLRNILLIGSLISIVIILMAGRLLSRQALKPMAAVVSRVEEITATNLDLRVDEGNGKDEIAELAVTFNRMLDRLENSFDSQKEFVTNIAHELRTPLAAIIAELELARARPRAQEEYQAAIDYALKDARKLSRLATGLMDMAKAGFDQTEIKLKHLRLDELLLDARQEIIKANPAYNIHITFCQEIEDDRSISVKGNEYLLKNALANVIENGCKYSPGHECQVHINFDDKYSLLEIADQGIGIDKEDIPHIFSSFYRGKNKGFAPGTGIGLSLTKKVIMLHQGEISLQTTPGTGTKFMIRIPHL
jgi:signal transduction histidine kinase